MNAKLLCIANWPDDRDVHPDYPITFNVALEKSDDDEKWFDCTPTIEVTQEAEADPEPLASCEGQMLKRDLDRLAKDMKSLVNNLESDHLTFVPITPLFELWVNRLSDDQYRVVVWLDMTAEFNGASNIGYQGIRFTSNRTRLLGFIRGLENALE